MLSQTKVLKAIRNDLLAFSLPTNFEGFFGDLCNWVIREWETRPYYHGDLLSFGPDYAQISYLTPLMLKDKALHYVSFIKSNNGPHYAGHPSTEDAMVRTMEKRLYEFFHESMRNRALAFITDNFPEYDADEFWTRIFCEDFHYPHERLVADDINQLFGFYAIAAQPYTCSTQPVDEGRFARWSLNDFKTAVGLIKGLEGERLGKAAMNAGRLFVLHKGGLESSSPKKDLSQNGAIA